ncbi:MAG: sugar ABC transporter permease [Blautia sp.]|nr:sugar ABC transporter permease [Blautia sp.]
MIGKALKKYWPLFVLPTFAAFIIGFVWPFIWGIYLSFCQFTTVKKVTFVGLSNYRQIFSDSTFGHAFWLTVLFAFLSSILINLLAFVVALVLTKGIRGTNVFRTIFFMPNLIGGIVLGYIWQTILNGLLSAWGQPLLALSAKNGFIGMLVLLCWQQIGYMMIIYIAGLNNVSPDLLEAAAIDGCTQMQTLFRIKIPMTMPSITICTFLTLTNGFKMFDQNLSLTGGEPAKATQLLALNIYDTFYARAGKQWKGIGQSKAVLFFLIVVVISLVQLRITSRKEVQA